MLISIIIATYNRCISLDKTLESLSLLRMPDNIKLEVIIADNNSSDNTRSVVEKYRSLFGDKIKYLFELRQGRTYALASAIRMSSGDIIATTDDDCIVDQDWLSAMTKVFNEKNVDLVGGKVKPILHMRLPRWLKIEEIGGPLVYYNLGNKYLENRLIGIFPPGANMAFRKSSLQKYGSFIDTHRGQDRELVFRWHKQGALVGYSPDMIIYHQTSSCRLKKNYFRKWFFLTGKHSGIFNKDKYASQKNFCGIPLWMYKELNWKIIGYLKSIFMQNNSSFCKEVLIWHDFGKICGFLNLLKESFEDIR